MAILAEFRGATYPLAMDLGLFYPALQARRIEMAAANATDGMLARPEFAVFEGGAGGALGPPPGFGHAPHERTGRRRPPVRDGSGPRFSK
jgi:hypothetical protein